MSSSRSKNTLNRSKNTLRTTKTSWSVSLRSPWTVACAAVAVMLGPSAVRPSSAVRRPPSVAASALERPDPASLHRPAAPYRPDRGPHHAAPHTAAQYAYLPRSTNRDQVLNRSQSLG